MLRHTLLLFTLLFCNFATFLCLTPTIQFIFANPSSENIFEWNSELNWFPNRLPNLFDVVQINTTHSEYFILFPQHSPISILELQIYGPTKLHFLFPNAQEQDYFFTVSQQIFFCNTELYFQYSDPTLSFTPMLHLQSNQIEIHSIVHFEIQTEFSHSQLLLSLKTSQLHLSFAMILFHNSTLISLHENAQVYLTANQFYLFLDIYSQITIKQGFFFCTAKGMILGNGKLQLEDGTLVSKAEYLQLQIKLEMTDHSHICIFSKLWIYQTSVLWNGRIEFETSESVLLLEGNAKHSFVNSVNGNMIVNHANVTFVTAQQMNYLECTNQSMIEIQSDMQVNIINCQQSILQGNQNTLQSNQMNINQCSFFNITIQTTQQVQLSTMMFFDSIWQCNSCQMQLLQQLQSVNSTFHFFNHSIITMNRGVTVSMTSVTMYDQCQWIISEYSQVQLDVLHVNHYSQIELQNHSQLFILFETMFTNHSQFVTLQNSTLFIDQFVTLSQSNWNISMLQLIPFSKVIVNCEETGNSIQIDETIGANHLFAFVNCNRVNTNEMQLQNSTLNLLHTVWNSVEHCLFENTSIVLDNSKWSIQNSVFWNYLEQSTALEMKNESFIFVNGKLHIQNTMNWIGMHSKNQIIIYPSGFLKLNMWNSKYIFNSTNISFYNQGVIQQSLGKWVYSANQFINQGTVLFNTCQAQLLLDNPLLSYKNMTLEMASVSIFPALQIQSGVLYIVNSNNVISNSNFIAISANATLLLSGTLLCKSTVLQMMPYSTLQIILYRYTNYGKLILSQSNAQIQQATILAIPANSFYITQSTATLLIMDVTTVATNRIFGKFQNEDASLSKDKYECLVQYKDDEQVLLQVNTYNSTPFIVFLIVISLFVFLIVVLAGSGVVVYVLIHFYRLSKIQKQEEEVYTQEL